MDLQKLVSVTGLTTQGYAPGGSWWTESYKVMYADNGDELIYVTGADGSPLEVRSYQDSSTCTVVIFPLKSIHVY